MKSFTIWFNDGGMEVSGLHVHGSSAVDHLTISRMLSEFANDIIKEGPYDGRHEQIHYTYGEGPNAPVVDTDGQEVIFLFRDTPPTESSELIGEWWVDVCVGRSPTIGHLLYVSELMFGLAAPHIATAVRTVAKMMETTRPDPKVLRK